ncbi:MAG: PilZ domain-containing protein [Bdellovibrionota bacterium]
MSENQPTNKRAAVRYPYVAQGSCRKEEKNFACVLQDISVSGIQIECAEVLELDQQIHVTWEDPKEGKIEGVFYIIRKFEKVDEVGKHYYGLRYYQLDQFAKQNVLNLLNGIKQQKQKETAKISLDVIYEVIDQGQDYIAANINKTEDLHPFFAKPLESLQASEKQLFQGEFDPYNEVVGGLVTHYFHCVLLKNVVPFALQKTKRIPDLFERVIRVIETSKELEDKEEAVFDYVKGKENENDLKMQYNQSTNRLFYGKQAMMEKVVKSMVQDQLAPELQEKLKYIAEHYDHTIELTNPNIGIEDIHTVSKKPPKKKPPKKESKYNKKESEFYVPSLEKKKGRGKFYLLGLILLLVGGGYGYQYYEQQQQSIKYQAEIKGLPIPIKKAYREGSQLYIQIDPADWAKLTEQQIKDMRTTIKAYLDKDKWLRTAIVRASEIEVKMIITTLA